MIKAVIYIFLFLTCFSCSTIQSSVNYTKGTEYLNKGNYPKAYSYLKDAVELDPNSSRSHNNLGFACLHLGDMDQAWYHAHRAAYLDPYNESAVSNTKNIWAFLAAKGDIKNGSTEDQILNTFGPPDEKMQNLDKMTLCYGTVELNLIKNTDGVFILQL